MRTYDIINAGPRNRFYCDGVIVSNSSRGIQLQNLGRGGGVKGLDVELAIQRIKEGAAPSEIREEFNASPILLATDLVRPSFMAKEGHWLARGDYSQIEARVSAWLGNQQNTLQAFRDYDTLTSEIGPDGEPVRLGPDIYKVTARDIVSLLYGEISIDEVTKDQRQTFGKVPVLACIASGELVLTDQGEVPIQHVTTDMKVWDGVEWVNHEGVVFKGNLPCMTYDGLTATPDHVVFSDPAKAYSECVESAPFIDIAYAEGHGLDDYGMIRPVWDILNAGPRHRFTVSGRLVHNCGFGGGPGALGAFNRLYGVNISEEDQQAIVNAFRDANPGLRAAWWVANRAAIECMQGPPGDYHYIATRPGDEKLMNPGTGKMLIGDHVIPPVIYLRRDDRRMVMGLPSGRKLIYWYPKIVEKETPWGRPKKTVRFMALDAQKNIWCNFDLYGGLIFQNAVQALSRDIAATSFVNLDLEGLRPILLVHDEAVCEVPKSLFPTKDEAAEAVRAIMKRPVSYAPDLPIDVDASAGERYVKA